MCTHCSLCSDKTIKIWRPSPSQDGWWTFYNFIWNQSYWIQCHSPLCVLFSHTCVIDSVLANLVQKQWTYSTYSVLMHDGCSHSCLQNRARALSSFPDPLTTLSKFLSLTPQLPLIRAELATYLYRRPQNHPVFYLIVNWMVETRLPCSSNLSCVNFIADHIHL